MDIKELTAPCGLSCWLCSYHKDNITDDLAQQTAAGLGLEAKDIPCDGCRSEKGCSFEMPGTGGEGCKTKECVANKGLHNCSECNTFPCDFLMPIVDRAIQLPHNTKLYNLSRIKLIGIEAWAKEASVIRQKYFKGTFNYGQSPSLD